MTPPVDAEAGDAGPGVPAHERAVVTGAAERTQLERGSGPGLWAAATAADACGGEVRFGDDEPAVVLRLPLADA